MTWATSATFDPALLRTLAELFDQAATRCATKDSAALHIAAHLLAHGYGIYRIDAVPLPAAPPAREKREAAP